LPSPPDFRRQPTARLLLLRTSFHRAAAIQGTIRPSLMGRRRGELGTSSISWKLHGWGIRWLLPGRTERSEVPGAGEAPAAIGESGMPQSRRNAARSYSNRPTLSDAAGDRRGDNNESIRMDVRDSRRELEKKKKVDGWLLQQTRLKPVCNTSVDCPAPSSQCMTATWTRVCASSPNTASGTALAAPGPGRLRALSFCDGQGNTKTVVDDTDVRVDGSPCHQQLLRPGSAHLEPRRGRPPTLRLRRRARVADGKGTCVALRRRWRLRGRDRRPEAMCGRPGCTDLAKDPARRPTVDCGGPELPACATGQAWPGPPTCAKPDCFRRPADLPSPPDLRQRRARSGRRCDDGRVCVTAMAARRCAPSRSLDLQGAPSVCTPICGDGIVVGVRGLRLAPTCAARPVSPRASRAARWLRRRRSSRCRPRRGSRWALPGRRSCWCRGCRRRARRCRRRRSWCCPLAVADDARAVARDLGRRAVPLAVLAMTHRPGRRWPSCTGARRRQSTEVLQTASPRCCSQPAFHSRENREHPSESFIVSPGDHLLRPERDGSAFE